MTEELRPEIAGIGVRLVEEAYLVWRAAESECDQALRIWSAGINPSGREAYWAYRAALDQEEAAARDLQKLHEVARSSCQRLARPENPAALRDGGRPAQFQ